ncbi:PD-(D/E)XK nuclease-like domain-containing protein [Nitrobacter sp. TKz-YC01]|uniref:PD-(D/E)XK nuclease-like domain-containing protein n=1 Tax=Nitrobacter sp. TKz-YC01 TaxID=3398703 RepID=UPI003A102DEE
MKIDKPGIFRDFSTDDYFADPTPSASLSQSVAKILIEQSPLHAKMAHPKLAPPVEDDEDEPEKYVKALAIGNAAHKLMLGRGKQMAVADFDSWRKKEAKEFREDAILHCREPILAKHYEAAERMVLAARGQLSQIEGCERAFREGDAEVVVAACEDGLWLRSMIDWITPDLREVWDLKTSGMSASPYNTGKLMASAGWHVQAAMHERILDAIDPQNAGRRRFLYVCQENEAPYALTVNEIGEAALTIGRKQIDYAVNVWRRCLETGYWPAYPLRIIRPELPAWHETSWLSREVAEEDVRLKIPARKDFDPKLIMAG